MIPIGTSGYDTVFLEPLKTHLHCIGTSQTGKSRLIEHLCTQLFLQRKGFLLIDPHGKLYDRVVRQLARLAPFREDQVTLFDASADNPHGFNPFSFEGGPKEIWTKAELLAAITLQVWGIDNPDDRPRFNNWLFNIFYTLMENGFSLEQMISFLRYEAPVPPGARKEEWDELHMMRRNDHYNFIEPLRSRFRPLRHPQLQLILEADTLDLSGVIDQQEVMLANFRESSVLTEQSNKTLAALFIAYIWHHVLTRKEKGEFYIIIDEFQLFATDRIASILDQAAKFGLHLCLFHQREGHMTKNLLDSMTNASAKIVFSGERTFTLNGKEVIAPNVADLEDNPPLDLAAQSFIESRQPPVRPVKERKEIPVAVAPHKAQQGKGGYEHKELQETVAGAARGQGFKAAIEKDNVDVSLEGHGIKIAVEVCVTQELAYEKASALKNLSNGYDYSIVITTDEKKAQRFVKAGLNAMTYQAFVPFLRSLTKQKPWLTAQEVADLKGWDVATVRRMANRGEIPAEKMGSQWRFNREKLDTAKPQDIVPSKKKTAPKRKKVQSRFDKMLD